MNFAFYIENIECMVIDKEEIIIDCTPKLIKFLNKFSNKIIGEKWQKVLPLELWPETFLPPSSLSNKNINQKFNNINSFFVSLSNYANLYGVIMLTPKKDIPPLSDLLSLLVHQLRSPLTITKSYIYLIKQGKINIQNPTFTTNLEGSMDYLLRLSGDLAFMSDLEEPKRLLEKVQSVELADFLGYLFSTIQQQLEETNVNLKYNIKGKIKRSLPVNFISRFFTTFLYYWKTFLNHTGNNNSREISIRITINETQWICSFKLSSLITTAEEFYSFLWSPLSLPPAPSFVEKLTGLEYYIIIKCLNLLEGKVYLIYKPQGSLIVLLFKF